MVIEVAIEAVVAAFLLLVVVANGTGEEAPLLKIESCNGKASADTLAAVLEATVIVVVDSGFILRDAEEEAFFFLQDEVFTISKSLLLPCSVPPGLLFSTLLPVLILPVGVFRRLLLLLAEARTSDDDRGGGTDDDGFIGLMASMTMPSLTHYPDIIIIAHKC